MKIFYEQDADLNDLKGIKEIARTGAIALARSKKEGPLKREKIKA
jgi:hypothetical protein